MTADELEKKVISIKKRGLNIMVEQEMISQIRAEYYTDRFRTKSEELTNRFVRNLGLLSKIHRDMITANKVRLQMGLNITHEDEKVYRGEYRLNNIRLAMIAAEYYGVPLEILLFKDITADEQLFRQQYPTLIRQNRD